MKTLSIFAFSLFIQAALFSQWQKIEAPFRPFEISVVDSNNIWAIDYFAIQPSSSSVFLSKNGGSDWSAKTIPGVQNSYQALFLEGINPESAWVGYNNNFQGNEFHFFLTTDGGQNWVHRQPSFVPYQYIFMVKFWDDKKGILLTTDFAGKVYVHRTSDSGQNWTNETLNISGSAFAGTTFGQNDIWFYTGSGKIWRSTDGGQQWDAFQTSFNATAYGLKLAFSDSQHGLAVEDHYAHKIHKTSDGGQTWQPVQGNPHPLITGNVFVWDAAPIPGKPGAWVLCDNEGTASSLDNGETWTPEYNYPDFDFRQAVFLKNGQGWGIRNFEKAIFRWTKPLESPLPCFVQLGPLSGKPVRRFCNDVFFKGSIRADISSDPEINLSVELLFPDNVSPADQKTVFKNLRTGCQDCPIEFVPDSGQTTIGEIRFEVPVRYAYDTSQNVICRVSPAACTSGISNGANFRTGYFATWFHPECFAIDTSGCAIELKTNVCGIDTNQYLIYHQVQGQPAVVGTRYEKNPSFWEAIRFIVYAYGDISNSTCYHFFDTLYFCGTSGLTEPSHQSQRIDFQLLPNPSSGAAHVLFDNLPNEPTAVRAVVRNFSGGEIVRKTFDAWPSEAQKIAEGLRPGLYFVELWLGENRLGSKKLTVVE